MSVAKPLAEAGGGGIEGGSEASISLESTDAAAVESGDTLSPLSLKGRLGCWARATHIHRKDPTAQLLAPHETCSQPPDLLCKVVPKGNKTHTPVFCLEPIAVWCKGIGTSKTDEVLKAKLAKREEEARKKLEEEGTSVEEQVRRIKDIEAIESDSFVPQAFKSSRDDIKTEPAELKLELDRAHSPDVTLPMSIVYNDTDTLAHPSLFMDKDKAEELWLNRLLSLRQERLMGSPVT
ncbi:Serine/Arginine-related protein 53 [Collichthys lucidus]|uniref:Serine/Arginine-related protein 53 n=1 Tax=Collichthys lucidus TaxID=240159 RepID=A0A4U5V0H8_COLLU|nr:Serine/Arginine-related protein 53 [Collichthys lucidus]